MARKPTVTPAAPRASTAESGSASVSRPAGRAARAPAGPRASRGSPTDAYHHGDLRNALIAATESLLDERGPEAFSLREVARRAGVSPAAPAYHFGDAAGLLTAVATQGFAELSSQLRAGNARGGADAWARLREQGVGYVQFALQHPARLRLMFRNGLLRPDPALAEHGGAAFELLEHGVRRAFGLADGAAMQAVHWQALLALWSVVHGYAHLAIAGQFEHVAPDGLPAFIEQHLRPMLDAVLRGVLASAPAARS